MKGLVFTGGEGPGAEECRRLAAEAGEERLIAAADSGLIAVEAAGLRPDWILGDMDSLDDRRRLDKYPADRVLRYPGEKDFTDTELALNLLWEQGCDETWLIGGGGGRLDHLLAIHSLFEREKSPDRWLTAADDVRCLRAGEILRFEEDLGNAVSVFPLGAGPWRAASRFLKWPLDAVSWNRGYPGVSNVITGTPGIIEVHLGAFLVAAALLSGGMLCGKINS